MQGLDWKDMLRSFLGFIAPFIYSELIGKYPDFPINLDTFTATIIWLVGVIFGIWNVSTIVFKRLIYKKYGVNYEQWIK